MGADSVRAQHERSRGHGRIRDGGVWVHSICCETKVRGARAHLSRWALSPGCRFPLQMFPTGDLHGKYMARNQPVTTAAMEGLFKSQTGAPIVILGQPDEEHQRIDNPIIANKVLSFLIYGTTHCRGPRAECISQRPVADQHPAALFSYHIMVGLGTIFVAVMALAAFLLWRRKLYEADGCFGSSCCACRSLTSLTPPDGLRRRSDASRGWSTGCCAPATDIPPMSLPATACSRYWAIWDSI